MRKLVIILFAIALGLVVASVAVAKDNAYNAGNLYLTGSTDLNLQFGDDVMKPKGGTKTTVDHTIFGLGTRIGYFVVKGFEIGLGLNYDYDQAASSTNETDDNGNTVKNKVTTTTSTYLVGPQGAYFFNLGGMDPFIAALIGYAGNSMDSKPNHGDKTTASAGGFAWDAAVGINFLVNPKVGIAPALFINMQTLNGDTKTDGGSKLKYTDSTTRYGLRIGVNLFL